MQGRTDFIEFYCKKGNYVIPALYSPWYAAECFSPPPEAFLETHSLFDNSNAWPGYLPMYQLELDPLRTSMTTGASISIFGEPTEHLLEDTTSSASPRHNIVGTAVIRAAAHKRRRGNHRKLYTCPICLTSLTSQTNWKGMHTTPARPPLLGAAGSSPPLSTKPLT